MILNNKFDIIFIDPPYGKIKIRSVIDLINKLDILNKDGLLVCEYDNEDLDEIYGELELIKDRKYGKNYIKIYNYLNYMYLQILFRTDNRDCVL